MSRKKHSMSKPTMLIAIIMAMSLLGISYGYWGGRLISQITAQTGYIDMCFEKPFEFVVSEEENVFSGLQAELEDNKTIKVTGNIEKSKGGKFELKYYVYNNGSLPVKFEKDDSEIKKTYGITITNKLEDAEITPGEYESDSVTISINESKKDDLETEGIESSGFKEEKSDVYEFKIVFPYKIGSWTDELTIIGEIKVVPSIGIIAMPIPIPAMTFMPVDGEIVTDRLPEDPSDEELYGEGGATEEVDDLETVEGDNEQAPEGNDEEEGSDDQEQAGGGEVTEEADEPEDIEVDTEPASEGNDEEEGSDNQEQTDEGEATEDAGESN